MHEPIDLNSEAYQKIQVLAKGSIGEIYKAWDTEIESWVAIKRLAPQYYYDKRERALFLNEIEILKIIDIPFCSKLLKIQNSEKDLFFIMDWISDQNLEDLIQSKILNTETSQQILFKLLETLSKLRSVKYQKKSGILHGDLHPKNILIRDNIPYIIDFSVSQWMNDTDVYYHFKGGPRDYIFFDILQKKQLHRNADYFTLALVYCEMISGQKVFQKETPFLEFIYKKEFQPDPYLKTLNLPENIYKLLLDLFQSIEKESEPNWRKYCYGN